MNTVVASFGIGTRKRRNEPETGTVGLEQSLMPLVILKDERWHCGIESPAAIAADGDQAVFIERRTEPYERLTCIQLSDAAMKLDAVTAHQRDEDRVGAHSPRCLDKLRDIDVTNRHKPVHDDSLPETAQHPCGRCVHLSRPHIVIADQRPSLHPSMPGEPGDRLAQLLLRITAEKHGSFRVAAELMWRGEYIGNSIGQPCLDCRSNIGRVRPDEPVEKAGSHQKVDLTRDIIRCYTGIDEHEFEGCVGFHAHLFGGQNRAIDNGWPGHTHEPRQRREQP
ncbi:MAG: hypothetical protein JWP05_2544 [Microbacteriaceae bacterium]|nr:hypothetical protein [Microbacteriaceae bacterium]